MVLKTTPQIKICLIFLTLHTTYSMVASVGHVASGKKSLPLSYAKEFGWTGGNHQHNQRSEDNEKEAKSDIPWSGFGFSKYKGKRTAAKEEVNKLKEIAEREAPWNSFKFPFGKRESPNWARLYRIPLFHKKESREDVPLDNGMPMRFMSFKKDGEMPMRFMKEFEESKLPSSMMKKKAELIPMRMMRKKSENKEIPMRMMRKKSENEEMPLKFMNSKKETSYHICKRAIEVCTSAKRSAEDKLIDAIKTELNRKDV